MGLVHIAKYTYSKLDCNRIIIINAEKDLHDDQANLQYIFYSVVTHSKIILGAYPYLWNESTSCCSLNVVYIQHHGMGFLSRVTAMLLWPGFCRQALGLPSPGTHQPIPPHQLQVFPHNLPTLTSSIWGHSHITACSMSINHLTYDYSF